jgi:hypothetical protein
MARGIRLADVSLGFDDDAGGNPASGFVDQNLADEIGGDLESGARVEVAREHHRGRLPLKAS